MMENIPETTNPAVHQERNEVQVSAKVRIKESIAQKTNVSSEQKNKTKIRNVRKTIKSTCRIKNSNFIVSKKKKKWITEKEYKCSVCSLIVENQLSLTLHKRKHISENKFTCSRCQETCDTNDELLEHKKIHRDEEKCFMCTTCEKAFSNEITFLQHGFIHIKKGPFKCPECLEISTDLQSLKHHIKSHFDTREACKICKALVLKHSMSSHVSLHTTVKCVECGKICVKANYKNHLTSHTGVKRNQCLYCGKGFSLPVQKKVHMRVHTGEKSFECKICFQKFTQQSTRNKHELRHSKERKFECDICHKKFKNKVSINHLRLHNNDRPYQCPSCPLAFPTSSHLTVHTYSVHITEKLFDCDLCNVKFKFKSDLRKHFTINIHQNNAYRLKKNKGLQNNFVKLLSSNFFFWGKIFKDIRIM